MLELKVKAIQLGNFNKITLVILIDSAKSEILFYELNQNLYDELIFNDWYLFHTEFMKLVSDQVIYSTSNEIAVFEAALKQHSYEAPNIYDEFSMSRDDKRTMNTVSQFSQFNKCETVKKEQSREVDARKFYALGAVMTIGVAAIVAWTLPAAFS